MAVDLAALWRRIDADFPGRPRERDRAWLEGVREWARAGDLLSYILYVHGHEHADVRSFCFSRHGLAMAEHMEGSRHTLIAAHPESGKTLAHRSELEQWIGIQTERAFADPDATVPSAAYIMGTLKNQAEPQVLFMRQTIEKSRPYRELFPHARPDKKAQWEKGKFFLARPPGRTRPEPTLIAMGCEGDIQGGRYGKITVDDPISQQDAKSDKIVRDRVAWILGTLERRLLQQGTLRYSFTRWHERDAFRPLSRICSTLVMPVYGFWEKHPEYNYQAETLWPEKWPRERVERERVKLVDAGFAYLWPLVWLCDPQAAAGSVIKRVFFHYGPNPLREAEGVAL